jgi:hypothetical protein
MTITRSAWVLSPVVLLAAGAAVLADPPSFARQVRPFLARYCLECHGGEDPAGGLNVQAFQSLKEGGDHGPVFTPGKADDSRIVRMVEGKTRPRMPPRKARQPAPEELSLLRAWIDAGARDDSADARLTIPDVRPRSPVAPPVAALAYHPSGKLLAAGAGKAVLLLDADTGEVRGKIGGLAGRVTALAFRRDGSALAVAASSPGGPHEVCVHDFSPTGPGKGRMVGEATDAVYALTFSPDGKLLATAGYDRLVRLWDVSSGGAPPRVLKDHSDAVYGLAFSPDGVRLASGAADRAVKVWDVATGRRLYTLGEPTDWVYAVAWSADGRLLAAAGVDRSIRVWGPAASGARLLHSVFAHQGPVTRLVYSEDSQTLYSLSEDGTAKAWDAVRMVERTVYAAQPDTPLALAVRPGGRQLAVGRFDGALVLLDEATGKTLVQPLPVKPKPPVLDRLSPSAVTRGRTALIEVDGRHLDRDVAVLAGIPGFEARALPGGDPGKRRFRITVPGTTPAGVYPVRVKSAGGESGVVNLTVDLFEVVAEKGPNGSPRRGQPVALPATVVGVIEKAGEEDWYRFEAVAGQEVGVQVIAAAAGSHLEPVLRAVDPEGRTLAESGSGLLGFTCPRAGAYALGVRDRDYRGGPAFPYRLHVGPVPVVTGVFPRGLPRGRTGEVCLEGVNLGSTREVKVSVPADAAVGSRVAVPTGAALGGPTVVVGEYPEVSEGTTMAVPVPGTANGRIEVPGASQTWHFAARKGERLILEVHARRLGSPLDSVIEILDARGRPLPRATLRCVARTFVAFRDHDAGTPGIRLETWNDLAINDYVLVGREVVRIRELPRNPDDDCQFFSERGQRLAYFGTTPAHHAMGEPMYKVTVHPPGATFPPNGLPVLTLPYRNDDGGPGLGKDSRLVFDPPADGEYGVRVGDAAGQGGPLFAYRLTVRPPRPDFAVHFNPAAPAVWKGGAVPVTATAERVDGFDDAIALRLGNLPPGFHAPPTFIPAGENSTSFALYADPGATVPPGSPQLKLCATAEVAGHTVVREVAGGVPRLAEGADIVTTTEQAEVTLRPGGEAVVNVRVQRRNGFRGRIPLEVRGLPHGVRVLDVGLNGILVTEQESVRTFVLYAEPWVRPMAHPFVVLARHEGKGAEYAAPSVLLRVTSR